MQLKVGVKGDQRLAENVILEVRDLARRFSLEIPSIRIVRRPSMGAKVPKHKVPKQKSRRKPL
jgi:hypothetical protein